MRSPICAGARVLAGRVDDRAHDRQPVGRREVGERVVERDDAALGDRHGGQPVADLPVERRQLAPGRPSPASRSRPRDPDRPPTARPRSRRRTSRRRRRSSRRAGWSSPARPRPRGTSTPGRSSPRATTGAAVPASSTSAVSQSSSPRPLRTIRSACAIRSTSAGVGSNVWTSPPLGTRLWTSTRVPPTWATRSASTVVVATTSIASGSGRGTRRTRRCPVAAAGQDDRHEDHGRERAEGAGELGGACPHATGAGAPDARHAAHRPNSSSRWDVTVNSSRSPTAARTSFRPRSSMSCERPQRVQIAWWWWTGSQPT